MKPPSRFACSVRFGFYLLREFRWPLFIFAGLVLGGGLLLQALYHQRPLGYAEACYAVFMLIFVQNPPNMEFPREWYLQPFFFLLPIFGLGALADSVVRLAYLVFAKKQKLPEWQRMVVASYADHFVVVGMGRVGLGIVRGLVAMRELVVVIEQQEDEELLDEVRNLGVPIIVGNARNDKTLREAGVDRARAIILATTNDLVNLEAALSARDLNPRIRPVLRLFDETLAAKFSGALEMPVISPSQVSAPTFIAAAMGRKVYQEFQLDGHQLHMVDLTIQPGGQLIGRTVGEIQEQCSVNFVMHKGPKGVTYNPPHETVLGTNDALLAMGPLPRLMEVEALNQPKAV